MVPREVVPHMEVASGVKAVPVMVNMNPAPPALTTDGVRLVMTGGDGLTVKKAVFEKPTWGL